MPNSCTDPQGHCKLQKEPSCQLPTKCGVPHSGLVAACPEASGGQPHRGTETATQASQDLHSTGGTGLKQHHICSSCGKLVQNDVREDNTISTQSQRTLFPRCVFVQIHIGRHHPRNGLTDTVLKRGLIQPLPPLEQFSTRPVMCPFAIAEA